MLETIDNFELKSRPLRFEPAHARCYIDVGVSVSGSQSLGATGGTIGATSVVDNSVNGSSGTKQSTIIIVAIALFVGLVFWTIFHEKD
jgi:hypothetical protein